MSNAMAQTPPILNAALSCRESFKRAVKVPRLRDNEVVNACFAEFDLWAAETGLLARGSGSLDTQLAENMYVRCSIAHILGLLEALVEKCIEAAGGADNINGWQYPNEVTEAFFWHKQHEAIEPQPELSPEEDQAIEDVNLILSRVKSLTFAVLRANLRARRHEADISFNPENLNPHLELFRKHLEIIVLARPSTVGSPLARLSNGSVVFAQCSREGTESPCLDTPQLSKIQSRLITANLRRRHRFLHMQTHDAKLANFTETNTDCPLLQDEGRPRSEGTVSTRCRNVETKIAHELWEGELRSIITASEAQGPFPLTETQTTQESMSGVTLTSSLITYPNPPPIQSNHGTFKCPCCCQTLAKKFALGNNWKKHLVANVAPYTCILDGCPSESELYLDRQSWKDHMRNDHSRSLKWACYACLEGYPPPVFNEEKEFITHIKEKHHAGIKDHHIPTLVSAWHRLVPTYIEACPLCSFRGETPAQLFNHVAQEVHDFSLRSLPWGPRSFPLEQSENEPDLEDDGNYNNYFNDNQYFGDGSEHTQSQNTAASPSKSLGEEGLPPLDYGGEDARSTSQSSHPKLTEDAMKRLQSIVGDSANKMMLSSWMLETLPLTEQGTDSNRGLSDNSSQSDPSLQEQLEEALVESVPHQNSYFLPISSQNELITVSTVARDIQAREPGTTEDVAVLLADKVCASARHLYVTLVCTKMEAMIRPFLNEGITDRDLPLVKSSNSQTGFALHRMSGETIKSLQGVSEPNLRRFDQMQWSVLAPVFKYGEHYELDDKTVLPFLHFDHALDRHRKKVRGYGELYSVYIHPAHHDFWESSNSEEDQELVAIKQLSSDNEEEFLKEVTILRALRPKNDPHMIKLLATYKYNGRYYLMFRYADSNLRGFWGDRPLPKFDRTTVLWSLKQICGISRAVSLIHSFEVTAPKDQKFSFRYNNEECFGRHGEIKPENILWFKDVSAPRESLGVLQISGFHYGRSSESVNADKAFSSPTYAPPEYKLRGPVSHAYDIWSLGCLYLEFITWLMRGSAEVRRFSDFRGRLSPDTGIKDFFTITTDPSGAAIASVRDQVIVWTGQLHEDERCSALIHDLLDLIMENLLIVEAKERIDAGRLYQVLLDCQKRAAGDEDYLLKSTPRNLDGKRTMETKFMTVSR